MKDPKIFTPQEKYVYEVCEHYSLIYKLAIIYGYQQRAGLYLLNEVVHLAVSIR